MTTHDVQTLLMALLDPANLAQADELADIVGCEVDFMAHVQEVRTFKDAGLLANAKGVVVTTEDGDEFQITIVKSR